MNQRKLDMVREETERVNINILGISQLKWTGVGKFNSGDHYIYNCRQESLRRKGVALTVHKSPNAVVGCSLKNNGMTLVPYPGKPFNTTVIPLYAPTTNAEEAEVKQFYEDLQDLLELTPKEKKKKRCPFHHRGLECKVGI